MPDDPADYTFPLRDGTCPAHGAFNNFSGRCLACIPVSELLRREPPTNPGLMPVSKRDHNEAGGE